MNKYELKLMLSDIDSIVDKAEDSDCFDLIETHLNCTVEVWKNTRTGEVSVGWYKSSAETLS